MPAGKPASNFLGRPGFVTEAEAMARLIAAAPELLEACKAARDLLRRIPAPGLWADSAERECEFLKAAIAKAEPKS